VQTQFVLALTAIAATAEPFFIQFLAASILVTGVSAALTLLVLPVAYYAYHCRSEQGRN
jgi:hypothetical protein